MKLLKGLGFILLLFVCLIFSSIGVAIIISLLQDLLLVPRDFLLVTYDSPTKYLIFVLIIAADLIVFGLISSKLKQYAGTVFEQFPKILKRHKLSISLSLALILYITIPNITIFTDTTIRHCTFLNPAGKKFSYKDIVSVDTGVYGKEIPFIREKGQFYYKVMFTDGTRIDLMDIGEETGEDTYYQIENIDRKVMDNKAYKIASLSNIELVEMDKVYVERFKRIIENK